MSVRNLDADLALSKLNDLFHLHRYDDCVLFINRVNHLTLKQIVSRLPVELYLSRLPYTIEIFEAIYAKVFIIEPDSFPTRLLFPEKIIDKMVAYFSEWSRVEPVNGAKMLDSFENVIRIISYVQPNLYSRLLFFKYAIDRALLKFDKDIVMFNKALTSLKKSKSGYEKSSASSSQLTLVISRAVNMHTCDSVRSELSHTIENSQRALNRLSDYISNLKSEKIYKEVEFYLSELNLSSGVTSDGKQSIKSPKVPHKNRINSPSVNSDRNRSKSSHKTTSEENDNKKAKTKKNEIVEPEKKPNSENLVSTVCQSFIQHRLYLNKAMMNVIEPYLTKIKIQETLSGLYEKVDFDKEILMVFSHLKKEENYLNSLEPLQPLFKRYSIGFERCIQIWRKKCYGDNLLVFGSSGNGVQQDEWCGREDENVQELLAEEQKNKIINELNGTTIDHPNELNSSSMAIDKINYFHQKQKQYTLGGLNKSGINGNGLDDDKFLNSTQFNELAILNNSAYMSSIFDDLNKSQKYFSEVNLNVNTTPGAYNTMPVKLRSQRKRSQIQSVFCDANQSTEVDLEEEITEILKRRGIRSRPALTKHVESQTNLDGKLKERQLEQSQEITVEKLSSSAKFHMAKDNLDKIEQNVLANEYKEEIARLNDDLKCAQDLILKIQKEENALQDKLRQKDHELREQAQIYEEKLTKSQNEVEKLKNESRSSKDKNNYMITTELITLYSNLNNKYRIEAYDSLHLIDQYQNVKEFKLKLLFSVIVLSFRYVKLHVRDLKKKIKLILQINDQAATTNERTNSQKSHTTTATTPMTPTILIQKPDESEATTTMNKADNTETTVENGQGATSSFFNGDGPIEPGLIGRGTNAEILDNAVQVIDTAVTKYLQVVTLNPSFDLTKIIGEVKEQLWSTLNDYPLKNCQELNSYINESVKTCWSLINHLPPFKLEYSSIKFDQKIHERSDVSNKQNDRIVQYVWPALIDTSDNSCLFKGIVIT